MSESTSVPPIVHEVLASPGQRLDAAARRFMEPRLGHDFSRVQIHTDARAAESARQVNALAYTVGRDIIFGADQFAPGTHRGQELLAHELVHAIQQESQPPVHIGSLKISQGGDPGEREADLAASQVMRMTSPRRIAPAGAMVDRSTRAVQVLARQIGPKTTAPALCTFNCTDPAFLALSAAAREAQFNAQCPQGYPATGNTFFGRTIPGGLSKVLNSRLLEAQSRVMRARCLVGQDPSAFLLPGPIITYASHSPAMDKAVDIDLQGQPYIMHEVTNKIPETEIDKEVGEVYNRIAFWSHYRKSIIPSGITSVSRPPRTSGAERTWRNPNTGAQEPTTTGELYDLLQAESTDMQGYFNLLLKSDQGLSIEIDAFLAFNRKKDSELIKLGLPIDESAASVQTFRQRIADDYRLLGGGKAQLEAFAGKPIASSSKTPPVHHGDRPFEGRLPQRGFLTLPRDIIVALTEVGLTWGAIDFGGGSGDVMHIDCRDIPGC